MKWLILGLLIILALVLFPTLNWGVGNLDMTSWIPLNSMLVTLIPYACVGIVIYFVLKNK